MKSTSYGSSNPLECPRCGDYRYLTINGVQFEEDEKKIGIKIPFFDCKNCNTSNPLALADPPIYDDPAKAREFYWDKARPSLAQLTRGELSAIKTPYEGVVFSEYQSLGYKYDSQDYFYIPGLYRGWNEGYLCPVFFNRDILLYYNNHPDYRVIFSSYSRLHIVDKYNKELIDHGFGINRNGNIICWLGDLHEEFSKVENAIHKNLFLTFNIESNHDIVSDYYFGQIEANFTEADNEHKVFTLRNQFDSEILTLTGKEITRVQLDNFVEEYKHPIVNETDQINSSLIKMNSILVESFNVDALKDILIESGIPSKDLKGLKGLKLFERFTEVFLKANDYRDIVSPLYVLYDLRVLAGHIKDSHYTDKLNSCKERLGLSITAKELETFNSLIASLIDMYSKLIEYLKMLNADSKTNGSSGAN